MLHNRGTSLSAASAPSLSAYPEKVYISRSRSLRPLAGEKHLEQQLTRSGFVVLHLERTPWVEQIRFFQQARVIAGPHGAGLANLVFAREGTTVIELTVGYMYNRCFEWISHVAGHQYLPLEADSQPAMGDSLGRAVIESAANR